MPGAVETGFRPSRRTPLPSFSPQRESRALAMMPTRSWPPQTPLPSFSPRRKSRAHTMRQHGHGRPKPRSRHSRRSGNPEPIQCANTVMAAPNPARVILAAAEIQSPYNRRSGNPEPLQCANTVMAAPNPAPGANTVILAAAAGIQSPYNAPTRSWPSRTPLASMPVQRVYC